MIKVVLLVDNDLIETDILQAKAIELFKAGKKEIVTDASGKVGATLVSIELTPAAFDLIKLAASRDESFGIQPTEYAITEEV